MEKKTQEAQPKPEAAVIIDTPTECPTCVSGTDPFVGLNPLFQEALLESL